ncbi:MAG: FliA/WhiG family RNA polymerase sigma factor [Candidatus Korobacteraceae bacterium]
MTSVQTYFNPSSFTLFPPPSTDRLTEDEQEKLVLCHMDDVRQVARSIVRRLPASVQLDDLIQAGCIGLIDAAKRYGTSRNLPFRQYARIRITGAIFDSLRELDWASRYFRTRQQKLDNATRSLESKLGRKPESIEIADSLGMDLNTFYEFAQAVQNRQEVEFEPQEEGEGRSIQESVADDPEKRPDSICHQSQSRNELRKFIAQLPSDEAIVVILYYFKDWTMARIARSIGKTESRVSQIHGKAMEHLRLQLGHRARELMTRIL